MSERKIFIFSCFSQNKIDRRRRRRSLLYFAGLFLLLSAINTLAQNQTTGGRICVDPLEAACQSVPQAIFKPYTLKFTAPDYSIGAQSEEFFAVLLVWQKGYRKNYQCNEFGEDQRLSAQRLFPETKVFSYNFHCYKLTVHDRFIAYKSSETNDSTHFLAIYGDDSVEKARSILKIARKNYPRAKIVKMYAVII